MAGVVKMTSPISRKRISSIRNSRLDRRLVNQHYGNVVFNRVDAFASRALQRGSVFDEGHRCLAVGTGQNREKFGVDRHAPNYMTPFRFCGTIPSMNVAAFVAGVSLLAASAAPSAAQPAAASASAQTDAAAKTGEAYSQFMLGRHLETADDIPGAIAAFRRAAQLDPQSSDIVAELAGLYMRQSKREDAVTAGAQALKIEPANREAHRVLGIVYATLVESARRNARTQQNATTMAENLTKAIEHLEKAIDRQLDSDPNVRATLSRLYLASGQNEKAIPLLQ